ncbi:MAG: hypothetical protein J6S67_14680 [Methanobrevibacter sp.]|nr:hypothetical protein [Methanobrevibacter sp.]
MNISNNPPCPYCGGSLIKKGFKKGKQSYICKDCGKWCTGEHPTAKIYFKDINTTVHCPHCNSMNISTSGYSNKGLRIYRCLSCRRRFTEETYIRLNKKYVEGEFCPRCGSDNLVNKGVNRIGNPRYKCKNCGRSYTKNAKLIHNEVRRRPPLSDSDKRKILMFKLNLGLSYPALAEHFNCSTYAIQQLVKEFHKGCRSEK